MEKHKLRKPIEFEGKTITSIELDMEGLSVADLEKCERQTRTMLAKKEYMGNPVFNVKYQSCVAAKAAGVKLDLIRSLAADDYTQVCVLVQNFLLGGDSDLMEDEDEDENASFEISSSKIKTTNKTTKLDPDYTN